MSWGAAFDDRLAELSRQPGVRAPSTFGEIWNAEWAAGGLDTTFGVNKPFTDAYDELFNRTTEIAGKPVPELARERGLRFFDTGIDGRIETLGKIVDSLPEHQSRLLEEYKDVSGRARAKARRIQDEAAEVGAATYGLSGHAWGLAAGIARQMVDPVNLATAPISAAAPAIGAGRMAMVKWLGKEFAIGATTQAAQEPYIRMRREELGLPVNSFENILQAGIGQAGFSALLRGAAAAYRSLRQSGKQVPAGLNGLSPDDLEAAAHLAERDGLMDHAVGLDPANQEQLFRAGRALSGEGRLDGPGTTKRALASEYDHFQPIIRPDGTRYRAKYILVERANLIVSHDLDGNANPQFPQELQPRDRERAASRLWVTEHAARLEPELLGAAPTAREGAPVVGPDGIVESGNGRVLLLDAAYRDHPERAQAYRDFLESKGFSTEGLRQPVLVRARQEDLSLAERKVFTDESNIAATASLSASERAAKDARALDEGTLALWQGGDLGRADNAAFVRRFSAEVLTATERNAFMGDGGALSKEGAARIEAALVAKAWQRETIVKALAEDRDETSKSVLVAFKAAAPVVSRLQAAMADGRVGRELDVVQPLLDAFELVDRARRSGQKPSVLLDQADIEHGIATPEIRAAVALFYRNADMTLPAGWETIRDRIDWATTRVLMHEPGGFFADDLTAAQVLRMARVATENLSQLDMARAMSSAADRSTPAVKMIEQVKSLEGLKQAQPFGSVDEMYAGIEARQRQLVDALTSIGRGEIMDPDFKAKVVERGISENVGRKGYADVREVTDAVRAGAMIDRPADADHIAGELSKHFQVVDEGWKKTRAGYVDRKVIVVFDDGFLAEVQLMSRETASAKKAAHRLYEQQAAAEAAGDFAAASRYLAEQQRLWVKAYSAAAEEWSAIVGSPHLSSDSAKAVRASSSDIGVPDQLTSAGDTGTQPRFGQSTHASRSPDGMTQARLSKSNQDNLFDIEGASGPDMAPRDAQVKQIVKGEVNDPNLQAAASLLDENGGDIELRLEAGETASGKPTSARERLAEIADERKAAVELADCVKRTGGKIEGELP